MDHNYPRAIYDLTLEYLEIKDQSLMSRTDNRERYNTTLKIRPYDDDEDEDEEEEDGKSKSSKKGEINPCFITIENEEGGLERVQVDLDENQFTVQDTGYRNGYLKWDAHKFYKPNLKPNANSDTDEDEKDKKKHEEMSYPPKKRRKRIVAKCGQYNVENYNIPKKKRLYFRDVFVTMVDSPWRYTLLAFAFNFEEENKVKKDWTPCVTEIKNFASSFLFSVETQHTIGYGSRATSEECPSAIITMCIQSVIGVLSSSLITMHNGILYLLFRVSNIRKSQIIESHISAKLIHRKNVTKEGEITNYYSEYLKVVSSKEGGDDDRAFFMFPSSMIHKIDEDSPFYSMSPKDILNASFEMVVVLEGIVEPTGNSFQARSSYLPREILWGMKFENMISYSSKRGIYRVDMSYLNAVIPDDTPRLSMEMIEKQRRKKQSRPGNFSDAPSNPLSSSIITIDGSISNRRASTLQNGGVDNSEKINLDLRKTSLDSSIFRRRHFNSNFKTHSYHDIIVPVPEETYESCD
ncbi:KCNJN [Lepeophtheirus salmonis]|uniref:KCNJN n=1 Tax=Lepeophtheirus salmonis TaxID=72036 RepID=A0A7R8CKY5_LEPSM|nr:KCNJN [Lepeophtheirus salmonis]CAF2851038.1 KCNJN [Lepeophtheirus salmonis]